MSAGTDIAPLIRVDGFRVLAEGEESLSLITSLRVLKRLIVLDLAFLLVGHLVVKEEVCHDAFTCFPTGCIVFFLRAETDFSILQIRLLLRVHGKVLETVFVSAWRHASDNESR